MRVMAISWVANNQPPSSNIQIRQRLLGAQVFSASHFRDPSPATSFLKFVVGVFIGALQPRNRVRRQRLALLVRSSRLGAHGVGRASW